MPVQAVLIFYQSVAVRSPTNSSVVYLSVFIYSLVLSFSVSFVVTWVVPMLYIFTSRMCNCNKPTVTTVKGLQLIHAVQSIVNPVIYCFRLPEFKERLKGEVQKFKCLEDGQREEANEWEMTPASKNEASKSVRERERELGEILRPCEGF